LLGSFLIPLLGWTGRSRLTGYVAVALIGAANVLTWTLLGQAQGGVPLTWHIPIYAPMVSLSLTLDALSVFMAFASSLLATLIAIYSLGYIEHTEHESEYYFIVTCSSAR